MFEHRLCMFAINNCEKKLVKKSQNCLFAVSNCEQKRDNVITLEGTGKVEVMLKSQFFVRT